MSKQEDEPGLGADVDQPAGNAAASDGTNASSLFKSLLEKVKRGEIDEMIRLVRESGVDMSQVFDESKNFS